SSGWLAALLFVTGSWRSSGWLAALLQEPVQRVQEEVGTLNMRHVPAVREHSEAAANEPSRGIVCMLQRNDAVAIAPNDQGGHRKFRETVEDHLALAFGIDQAPRKHELVPQQARPQPEPELIHEPVSRHQFGMSEAPSGAPSESLQLAPRGERPEGSIF